MLDILTMHPSCWSSAVNVGIYNTILFGNGTRARLENILMMQHPCREFFAGPGDRHIIGLCANKKDLWTESRCRDPRYSSSET